MVFLITGAHRAASDSPPVEDDVAQELHLQKEENEGSKQQSAGSFVWRLRNSVRRIEQTAADIESILKDVIEDGTDVTKQHGGGSSSDHGSIPADAERPNQQQHEELDSEAFKRRGSAVTKGGRRYDTYGVAGRFGRSVSAA
jgi:hypothetical protein